MAKKLTFEIDKKFGVTTEGALFVDIFSYYHLLAKPSSREEHKTSNRILDALEEISLEDEPAVVRNPRTDEIIKEEDGSPKMMIPASIGFQTTDSLAPRARHLRSGRQYVVFEDHQFEFLTKALAGIVAPACRSREIEAMWEFLDKAKSGGMKSLVEEEQVVEQATIIKEEIVVD